MSETASPRALVGNRLVLVGGVLYLLEWVAILAAPVAAPVGADAGAEQITSAYAGNTTALAWAAGWLSVVLLGRVLLLVGLRAALRDSGRPHVLMDLAVLAMLASVVIETVVYAVVAAAAWLGENGATAATVRALDAAAWEISQMIYGPLGVAVICAAVAMWRSGLFPRALCGLGVAGGAAAVLVGLAFVAPAFVHVAATLSLGVLLFWAWMLWTGVLCWWATGVGTRQAVSVW